MKLTIYDTTLRDGSQTEGLALSIEDKLRIALLLDRLGVDFIEGGWPGANPKDNEFFRQVRGLKHSQLVAFCSTRKAGLRASADPMLVPILAAQTQWVTIFGKSWDLHVLEGLRTTLDENLAMIQDTIGFLRSHDRQVIYDAEHWFDGFKHNPDYALSTLKMAALSGAEWLVLCDTNGGSLTHEVSAIVSEVKRFLTKEGLNIPLGIHTHNDCELAVSNTIGGVSAGCQMVQGTMNGYGERCGNANLCSAIPVLQLKLGHDCLPPGRLALLTPIAREISEIVNLAPNEHAPFVGMSAFAHKGGIHVSAVERNPATYEHISPEVVGNHRRIVISEQSGLSNVLAKARVFGIELQKEESKDILQKMKDLEQLGYQFEAAEASFELLMREALDQRPHFFYLQDFQVHCQGEHNGNLTALATVKVIVNNEEKLTAAEGNGPVSALDTALRKALVTFYPLIDRFYLTDYKVRILNGNAGTKAQTRVLIESSNGTDRWTTVGVSSNIIAASCIALVDSLEYGLMKS